MPDIPRLRLGRCTVCDRMSIFVLRHPTSTSMRGEMRCLRCGSRGRNRHVAMLVAQRLGVASLSALRAETGHRVLNTSHQSALGQRLTGCEHITTTGFWPDVGLGEQRDGVRCEDLTALTFDDATFHLVITEDVLEHIAENMQAFAEIRRVLKSGGHHVFSIPFRPDRPSRPRFTMTDGAATLDEPISYHTDPGQGRIPVFHDYGYTLFEDLAAIGFETRLVRSRHQDNRRNAIIDCTTFVSRAI